MKSELPLLRASLNSSRDGILIVDHSSRAVLQYNQRFLEIFGFTAEDGAQLDDRAMIERILSNVIEPKTYLMTIEELYQHPERESLDTLRMRDGRTIERHSNALSLNGQALGRVWFFRDITLQEKTRAIEQARAQSMTLIALGASLPEILDSIIHGVEALNPDFVCSILVLDHNRTHLALSAAPSFPNEPLKLFLGSAISPQLGICGLTISTKRRVIMEDITEHREFDQLRFMTDAIGAKASWSEPILDSEGHAIGSFGIYIKKNCVPSPQDEATMHDAANLAAIAIQRRRSEEKIKSQELRFRTVFEGSNDAIILSTKEAVIDCNQRAWQLFEMPNKQAMLGAELKSFSPPQQPSGLDSLVKAREYLQIALDKGSVEFPWIHRTFKGRNFSSDVVIRAYYSEGRRVMQFTIRDSTERLAAQQAIDSQREKLVAASKMSSLGEMAGGVAHEINNPLAIIIGQAARIRKRIERGLLVPATLGPELSKIEATAQRIAKIIKGLRTFSRESEQDPKELVSLNQILDETLELCQEKIRHSSIELQISKRTEAFISCRPGQISQVILNLLSNAADAVEDLSEKWIRVETDDSADGLEVLVAVTDSGLGIDEKLWDKLMQPFFTTKEVGKGTGLGLSISRGITENHGGTLTYDSSSPHTRFILRLPRLLTRQSHSPVEENGLD